MALITRLSQRDPRWANIRLGWGDRNTTTIGSHGCTVTCIAMLAGLTPDEVNRRLIAVKGFAAGSTGVFNLVIWQKVQEAIPWLQFEWRNYSYDNDRVSGAISKNGGCLVEVDFDGTPRTDDRHWVLYIGNQKMNDPWTGTERATSTYSIAKGFAIINKVGQPPESGGDMANMYRGYDLANPESMKVAVDEMLKKINGEYVSKSEMEAKVIQAEKKGYESGFAAGKKSVPAPQPPAEEKPIIPEDFAINGMQLEYVLDGVKVTENYGKKG